MQRSFGTSILLLFFNGIGVHSSTPFKGAATWYFMQQSWKYKGTAQFTIINSKTRTSVKLQVQSTVVGVDTPGKTPSRWTCEFEDGEGVYYESLGGAFIKAKNCPYPLLFVQIARSNYSDIEVYAIDPTRGCTLSNIWYSRGEIDVDWYFVGPELIGIRLGRTLAGKETNQYYVWSPDRQSWVPRDLKSTNTTKRMRTLDWKKIGSASFAFGSGGA